MMIIDEAGLTTALLFSATLLLGAASLVMLRFERLYRSQLGSKAAAPEKQPDAGRGEPLQQEINALQKCVDELVRKQETAAPGGLREMPLENAVRMARCGAGIDELTRSCGLKRGEAALLLRLHANRGQSARTH